MRALRAPEEERLSDGPPVVVNETVPVLSGPLTLSRVTWPPSASSSVPSIASHGCGSLVAIFAFHV
jgi:hypothetical protein